MNMEHFSKKMLLSEGHMKTTGKTLAEQIDDNQYNFQDCLEILYGMLALKFDND